MSDQAVAEKPAQKAKRIMDAGKRKGKSAEKVVQELHDAGPMVATAASLIIGGAKVEGDDTEEKTDFSGMEKDELVAHIARLHVKRRSLAKKAVTGLEMLQERISQLPAAGDVEDANKALALAKAKLNSQKDQDGEFKNLEKKLQEVREELNDIEGSLSDALVVYMIQTKSKTVHIDPNEPESIDREIRTFARIGKKVPAQLDLFEQEASQ